MCKTILITGATDGIGRALTRAYRARGHRLVLIGRRAPDVLDGDIFTETTYCQADLSKADCAEKVMAFLHTQKILGIDLAIQNAGMGYYGDVAAQSATNIHAILAVNLMAPMRLSQALYAHLKNRRGKLVLIGSVAHALPCATYAVYAASKAALDALGRNLRLEFAPEVQVQTIHPGATRTGLHEKLGLDQTTLDWTRFPSAEKVAEKIMRFIDGQRPVATVGLGNAVGRFAGRYLDGIIDGLMRRGAR